MSTRTESRLATKYAKALFDLSVPEHLENRRRGLEITSKMWSNDAALRDFLKNPAVLKSKRLEIVRMQANLILNDDTIFSNFLSILLSNHRLDLLPQVSLEFNRLVEEFKKILSLEITSAFELSSEEQQEILNKIQSDIGSKHGALINITWKVDQKILGGLVIKIGDKLLDGSVRLPK